MRAWALLPLLAYQAVSGQVRINELHCTRAAGSDGKGMHGDWLELYNAGSNPVDLAGYALVINGVSHHLQGPLSVAPRACRVLWCDGEMQAGTADHLSLKLPRTGGTVLLVAADRTTVLDVFHWPALPAGCSMGRKVDGGRAWGFFDRPGPGTSNTGKYAVDKILQAPTMAVVNGRLRIDLPQGSDEVRYTLDGSEVDRHSPRYDAPLAVATGTVVRARAYATGAIASGETVSTPGVPAGAWSLVVDPADLQGEHGIADVATGNFSRSGPEWQRQAWLQCGAGAAAPLGIAIAGSGTRNLPKRNFKLFAKDRFDATGPVRMPDGNEAEEVILRADASPNAFLHNLFMKEVARRSGGNVDVQRSSAVPLYLNGAYQGLYRVMPAKNKAWAKALNNGGAVDLIDGTGPRAVSGKLGGYASMLRAMANGADADQLDSLIDLNSLIDLACFDLWTGRADHDLNVRCWKSRTALGKWRWVLYDMDQWAPPTDHTVQRMCAYAAPETPFVPVLLKDDALRDRLLARMSALLATTLSPDRGAGLLDSLVAAHGAAMAEDYSRWHGELIMPNPKAARTEVAAHIKGRNAPLLAQLRQGTGLKARSVEVAVEPAGAGTILLEDLALTTDARHVDTFAGVPLHFLAVPGTGMEFLGWRNAGNGVPVLVLSGQRDEKAVAVFGPAGISRKDGL